MGQPKPPQQMQDEINSLMAQYQAMYNGGQPQQQQKATAVGERGEFVKVSGIDEVEEAPTRLDGTATLFFDFKNRVFWSKKYSNGGHTIQAFRFEPINTSEPQKQEEEIDYTAAFENIPDPTEERFGKIETTLAEILEALKTPKQRREKEAPKDEI